MAYFQMPLSFHLNSPLEEIALKWTHTVTLKSCSVPFTDNNKKLGASKRYFSVEVTSGLVSPAHAPPLEI